jgi:carboxymethylenebutenolidase
MVDRQGAEIDVRDGEHQASAYLAAPQSGRGGAIVVVHDEWGLGDFARDVCDRLARADFVALAPDWLDGACATQPEEAEAFAKRLDEQTAGAILDRAVVELLSHDAAVGRVVGVLGFGRGGGLAVALAGRAERVGAAATCDMDLSSATDIPGSAAPLLAVFAGDDPGHDATAVDQFEERLRGGGKRYSVRKIAGVRGGFMNDSRPDVHDAVAEFETWDTLLAFFRAELS